MRRIPASAGEAIRTMLNECYAAFSDNATSFSCAEIELIADAYVAIGEPGVGLQLIQAHAVDDDEGDPHYAIGLRAEAEEQESAGHTSAAAKLYEEADDWEKENA